MTKKTSKYMTPAEVAKKLGMTEGTLANWRSKDMGPRWITVAGKIVYKSEAVSIYISNSASSIYWNTKTPIALNWKAPSKTAQT
jgi:hypothetical protein